MSRLILVTERGGFFGAAVFKGSISAGCEAMARVSADKSCLAKLGMGA
jgi:hypothetical protein